MGQSCQADLEGTDLVEYSVWVKKGNFWERKEVSQEHYESLYANMGETSVGKTYKEIWNGDHVEHMWK